MRSAYLGLDVALRALQANQQALETTSHNIANANTEGYSRQESVMTATSPYTVPTLQGYPSAGQVGTGVMISTVKRYRDEFMNLQVRQGYQDLAMWGAKSDALQQVELVLPEPSDSGLGSLLNRFWDYWSDLSNSPQDPAVRVAIRQQTANLCSSLNQMHQQLVQLGNEQDTQIQLKVQEINIIAERIARLNVDIQEVQATGNQPNDLRDQRDLLLDDLSKVVNISYQESERGAMSVFIGGTALVADFHVQTLVSDPGAQVRWSFLPAGSTNVDIYGGVLGGSLAARESIINRIAELDCLANGLIDAVNDAHRQGFGLNDTDPLNPPNRDFFTGTGAGDIALHSDIQDNADNIAASALADAAGDGRNASEIAALRTTALASLGGNSISGYYAAMITQLGAETKTAKDTCSNLDALVDLLQRQRDSVSGVSLDEEATNLIKYERAYQAASRVMTTVDEMLDRLINGTGRVGL
jgi:flagellar hook-associated protein 1 FlgK